MSDIKAGDLVMVVGGCCADYPERGMPFMVHAITLDATNSPLCCRAIRPRQLCAHVIRGNREGWIPLSWLRKIDPPAEDVAIERDEAVPA